MTGTTESGPATDAIPTRRRRSVWAWIAIAAIVLGVGTLGAAIASTEWSEKGLLDPDSPGPDGSRALVQILRAQGVEVVVARSWEDAEIALGESTATLVVTSTWPLSDDALTDLAAEAGDLVLVDPSSRDVRVLFGSGAAGYAPDAVVPPDCELADAQRAGPIIPGALYMPRYGIVACYDAGDGSALLVADGDTRTSALDATVLFTNELLDRNGNAALAINLMGRDPHVVWYLPSPFDSDLGDTTPSIGDLTPGWVTPALTLLAITAVVAGVWRGRRFGPLVAEKLPVTVRAAETMEGRARLYARSRDAVHALDTLRLGTLDRLAAMLGLGPSATAGEIADAAADRIAAPRPLVRDILIDAVPRTDIDLVAASDRLRDLEAAVRSSLRIERNDP